jgi:hypothetical protein
MRSRWSGGYRNEVFEDTARFKIDRTLSYQWSQSQNTKPGFVARSKLLPCIRVALPPEMLQRVGGRHAPQSGARHQVTARSQSLQKAAPEGITDAGGVDDPMGRQRGNIHCPILLPDGTAVLTARHDQRGGLLHDR